jgi:outer membrane protein TolC
MTDRHRLTSSIIICLLLSGCNTNLPETRDQTDAAVYDIIDQAWQNDLGSQSNYKLQDIVSEPNELRVSVTIPDSGILTLPDALATATSNNRQYITEKEYLYLTALDYTEIRHLYEPMPIWGGEAGYRRENLIEGREDNEGLGLFTNYGFQQLLATGAQIGADVSMGWLDISSGNLSSGFSTVITTVVTQPLLRGSGRKIALENLTQGQRNTLYQVRSFNRFRKDFLTSIAAQYYQVLALYDRHRNIQDYYVELTVISYRLNKRSMSGRIEKHEAQQSEQDRLIALADYVQAYKDYEEAIDTFKLSLALSPKIRFRLDNNELDQLRNHELSPFNLTEDEAIEIALNQRLDLANAADSVQDAQRKVDLAADAIRTELNLVGYTDTQTPERTVFGADPGELERTRDRYQISMELDLPVDRLVEKNNYRRALIALMQHQRNHQELTDTVILEVRNAFRRMKEAHDQHVIEQTNVDLAQSRTRNTLLLLQYDRASTRDVLDAQKDLLNARNAVTDSLVRYLISSLEYLRDTGTLKVKPDGMWKTASGTADR